MSFYLKDKDGSVFVTDAYLRNMLLSKGEITDINFNIKNDENEQLKLIWEKLEITPPTYSYSDLVERFMQLVSENNIDDLSAILTMNKLYILTLFYLLNEGRIGESELKTIFESTSTHTRKEIILSYLRESSPTESIDILGPFLNIVRKFSSFKNNPGEFDKATFDNAIERLSNTVIDNSYYVINAGNYFYENEYLQNCFNKDRDSLLDKCDIWKYGDDHNINTLLLTREPALTNILKDMDADFMSNALKLGTICGWIDYDEDSKGGGIIDSIIDFFKKIGDIVTAPTNDLAMQIFETEEIKNTLFNSSPILYGDVCDAAARFCKFFSYGLLDEIITGSNDTVNFSDKFCKNKLYVNKGQVEADILGHLVGTAIEKKFKSRLGKCDNFMPTSQEITTAVKDSFAIHMNQSIRLSDAESIYSNFAEKPKILNVYSVYDKMIQSYLRQSESTTLIADSPESRYRYTRYREDTTRNSILSSSAIKDIVISDDIDNLLEPFRLSGDSVGALRSADYLKNSAGWWGDSTAQAVINGVTTTNTHTSYLENLHSGFIDLINYSKKDGEDTGKYFNSYTNITASAMNQFSDITGVVFDSAIDGYVQKTSKNISLTNGYFVKNHTVYAPANMDLVYKNSKAEDGVKDKLMSSSINTTKISVQISPNNGSSGVYYRKGDIDLCKAVSSVSTSNYKPSFHGLKELVKYDYLVDDQGYIVNFGTLPIYEIIKDYLGSYDINSNILVDRMYENPESAINEFKDKLNQVGFSDSPSYDDMFVTAFLKTMIGFYLDYLVDAGQPKENIYECFKLDGTQKSLYVMLYIYRHSIVLAADIIDAYRANSLYKQFDTDPFLDSANITKIINFFDKYDKSNRVKKIMEMYNVYRKDIERLYVGKIPNTDSTASVASGGTNSGEVIGGGNKGTRPMYTTNKF